MQGNKTIQIPKVNKTGQYYMNKQKTYKETNMEWDVQKSGEEVH